MFVFLNIRTFEITVLDLRLLCWSRLLSLSSDLSRNREGRWGTTDDYATSFLHFPLFSTALWDLPNSRPVHSLMLSSHLFLCLPCLLPLFHCALQDGFDQTWWTGSEENLFPEDTLSDFNIPGLSYCFAMSSAYSRIVFLKTPVTSISLEFDTAGLWYSICLQFSHCRIYFLKTH